ncbi:MAG: hypothetical protein ACKON9_02335, partial [Planctomycetaceae bacterium]
FMRNNSKVAKAKSKAQASVSEAKSNMKEAAKLAAELRRQSNWEALGFASFDQLVACMGILDRIYQLGVALINQAEKAGAETNKNAGFCRLVDQGIPQLVDAITNALTGNHLIKTGEAKGFPMGLTAKLRRQLGGFL